MRVQCNFRTRKSFCRESNFDMPQAFLGFSLPNALYNTCVLQIILLSNNSIILRSIKHNFVPITIDRWWPNKEKNCTLSGNSFFYPASLEIRVCISSVHTCYGPKTARRDYCRWSVSLLTYVHVCENTFKLQLATLIKWLKKTGKSVQEHFKPRNLPFAHTLFTPMSYNGIHRQQFIPTDTEPSWFTLQQYIKVSTFILYLQAHLLQTERQWIVYLHSSHGSSLMVSPMHG
jgi:hypothetical protein